MGAKVLGKRRSVMSQEEKDLEQTQNEERLRVKRNPKR